MIQMLIVNQKHKRGNQKKIEKQKKMKLPSENLELNKDILEEHHDPIDEWLTENLFTKKPIEGVTKEGDAPLPTCANSEVDSYEVAATLKYASKRALLKKVQHLETLVDKYRSITEYNFCLKCKKCYDRSKEEKMREIDEPFVFIKGKQEKK